MERLWSKSVLMPSIEPNLDDLPAAARLREALQTVSGNDDQSLFVLLDGARIPKLWILLRELKIEHRCLFREHPRENLVRVAPFLARCELRGDLLLWLALQEQALDSALFMAVGAGIDEIFTHLRRFLLVVNSAGKQNYLRFYDPRVLRPFLNSSTPAEKQQFFGPIRYFASYDAARSEEAGKLMLQEWRFLPQISADAGNRPSSATDKFRLSKDHESEFARDSMERYDRRCAAFLREEYTRELANADDDGLRVLVNEAKKLGPALGLTSGRDVAVVAELLVLGLTPEMKSDLAGVALKDRPRGAQLLRDRLISRRMAALGA